MLHQKWMFTSLKRGGVDPIWQYEWKCVWNRYVLMMDCYTFTDSILRLLNIRFNISHIILGWHSKIVNILGTDTIKIFNPCTNQPVAKKSTLTPVRYGCQNVSIPVHVMDALPLTFLNFGFHGLPVLYHSGLIEGELFCPVSSPARRLGIFP